MTQHLAHEVRVAVGLAIDGVSEAHSGVVEGLAGCGLQICHHIVVVQPAQLDAAHATLAAKAARVSVSGWERDSSLSR